MDTDEKRLFKAVPSKCREYLERAKREGYLSHGGEALAARWQQYCSAKSMMFVQIIKSPKWRASNVVFDFRYMDRTRIHRTMQIVRRHAEDCNIRIVSGSDSYDLHGVEEPRALIAEILKSI